MPATRTDQPSESTDATHTTTGARHLANLRDVGDLPTLLGVQRRAVQHEFDAVGTRRLR